MPGQLYEVMKILREIFDRYAGLDGDSSTMTQRELAELIKIEFFDREIPSESKAHQIFDDRDTDRNRALDFIEFITVAADICLSFDEP